MNITHLITRIEQAKSNLESAQRLISDAQSQLRQETPEPQRDAVSIFTETLLATTAGATLGVSSGSLLEAPLRGLMGGLNGFFTGLRGIYDWDSPIGREAFIADSTRGLLGTSLGNLANIFNSIADPSSYRADLSERQNRQVYDGGLFLEDSAALTLGNVVSNLQGRDTASGSDLLRHETVHILQNREFGSLYPLTYGAWYFGVGVGVGTRVDPFTEQGLATDIRDLGYVNNPWEQWAFRHGGDDGGGELAQALDPLYEKIFETEEFQELDREFEQILDEYP